MAVLNSLSMVLRRRDPKRSLGIWFIVSALMFSGEVELSAQPKISKEYQVKAVFLFNFAQFVAWPTNTFPEAQTPLRIGVLGDDPFDAFLDETVRGEKVGEHPLVVQRYHRVEDIQACHILFISRSESKRMKTILADLRGKNILTVGDVEGFIKDGGVVRFVAEQNKVRFRISLEAAKNANVIISSKPLRLAEIVGPGKD